MGKINSSNSIFWSLQFLWAIYLWCLHHTKCCRFCLYAWQMFDIFTLGNYSWSHWSKTCYSYRNYFSVSIYVKELHALFVFFFEVSNNHRCLLDFSVSFNTLFALSTSFWMAVIVRFLLGSLNCLLGPVKVSCFSLQTFTNFMFHPQLLRYRFLICPYLTCSISFNFLLVHLFS